MGTVAAAEPSALADRLREQERYQQELADRRVRDRAAERAPALANLDEGAEIAAANDPVRVARRVDRVSRYLTGRDPDSVPADAPPDALLADAAARLDLPEQPDVLLERVINQPDFLAVRYLEGGHVAQRTVGRVVIRDAAGRTAGYGTGFLVSAHLMLTNHHVLPSAEVAASSAVELDYQRGLDGRRRAVVELRFDPARFFVADPALDFALVQLAGAPASTAPFGWSRLTEAQGTVVVGESVSIVQHPRGREKEVVLRENKLVDIPEQVLHYLTDTEPGSSGSPVFNDQWEVVALHHASVRLGDQYVNEGIRISRILRHVRAARLDAEGRARVAALGTAASPHGRVAEAGVDGPGRGGTDGVVADGVVADRAAADGAAADGTVTFDVPVRITVSVRAGEPGVVAPAPPALAALPAPQDVPPADVPSADVLPLDVPAADAPPPDVPRAEVPPTDAPPDHDGAARAPALAQPVEELAVDPDYAARGGYDPDFLGVPLPLPGAGTNAAVASAELRYHHFSVVMHRERRLALLAAVNLDGARADGPLRSDDRWILDPRLPREEQTGAEVYRDNALDRGHLVRRLDPAWGSRARAANDDTFHYTNSAPQHHAFNAGSTLWLGLEEYVLGTARRERLRVSVVSGPVLAPDDPPYRGGLLPRQFYKVVAVVGETGALSVTAYVLGQHAFLPGVLTEGAFGPFRTFQVPVSLVATLTGLDLAAHAAADPLRHLEATVAARPLRSYADVVLGP